MKKRLLLALPLIVLPLLTLLLWSVGLFHPAKAETQATAHPGLITTVPKPIIKEDKTQNKMSFYDQAKRDSMKVADAGKTDPNYKGKPSVPGTMRPTEQKVVQKIAQLQNILHETPHTEAATRHSEKSVPAPTPTRQADPEIAQLNQMMDKILEIQHPERATEHAPTNNLAVSIHEKETTKSGFFSLNETKEGGFQNAIEATVPETQILEAGSMVKLLVLSDLFINGFKVPKNSFVYGIASLTSERLHITISSIRYQNSILPVSLKVYDVDGLEGIYIPGSVSRDVVKESSGEAVGSLGIGSFDQSLGAQAAGAGIQAAKSLFSKKIKQVKVTIRQGYKILLKDLSQKP